MRGPKPTPTKTLERRGSWRANERGNEPVPPMLTNVLPPDGLTERAEDLWTLQAASMVACGLLTSVDVPAFARYCRVYAMWESAAAEVEAEPSKQTINNLAKLDEMLRKLEANFGLSPADRARITVDAPTEDNSKSRFFGKELN